MDLGKTGSWIVATNLALGLGLCPSFSIASAEAKTSTIALHTQNAPAIQAMKDHIDQRNFSYLKKTIQNELLKLSHAARYEKTNLDRILEMTEKKADLYKQLGDLEYANSARSYESLEKAGKYYDRANTGYVTLCLNYLDALEKARLNNDPAKEIDYDYRLDAVKIKMDESKTCLLNVMEEMYEKMFGPGGEFPQHQMRNTGP